MSYTVSPATSVTLNETDTVAAVLQNVAVILATRQGNVPMYRDFGLKQNFVDRPIPVAKTLLVAEIREAVEKYEPRAEVVGVSFETPADRPGVLIPTVEVNITA